MNTNFLIPRYPAITKPIINISVPMDPNRCMGFFPKRVIKPIVNKIEVSFNESVEAIFCNAIFPRLVFYNFFSDFSEPCFFCKHWNITCISPKTSILFTTSFLYALSPQLKSCSLIPDDILAVLL